MTTKCRWLLYNLQLDYLVKELTVEQIAFSITLELLNNVDYLFFVNKKA